MQASADAGGLCALITSWIVAAGLAMLAAAPSRAADADGNYDPSRWLNVYDNFGGSAQDFRPCGVTPELRKRFRQQQQDLATVLQHTPGLPGPGIIGRFELDWVSCAHAVNGAALPITPGAPMQGNLSYWPFLEGEVARAPDGRTLRTGETSPTSILFNILPLPSKRSGVFPYEADIGTLPLLGRVQGFPYYETSNLGSTLVFEAPGHPPLFVPATLRESLASFLDPSIMPFERSNERGSCGEAARAHAADARALLARLDDTALAGPAYLNSVKVYGCHIDATMEILASPVPGSQALVRPNPAYFRTDLPRTDFQLMTIALGTMQPDVPYSTKEYGKYVVEPESTRALVVRPDWAQIARDFLH